MPTESPVASCSARADSNRDSHKSGGDGRRDDARRRRSIVGDDDVIASPKPPPPAPLPACLRRPQSADNYSRLRRRHRGTVAATATAMRNELHAARQPAAARRRRRPVGW